VSAVIQPRSPAFYHKYTRLTENKPKVVSSSKYQPLMKLYEGRRLGARMNPF